MGLIWKPQTNESALLRIFRTFPSGAAWPTNTEWYFGKLCAGIAPHIANAHNALNTLAGETHPRTTDALLSRFEQALGIPDLTTFAPIIGTTARRALVCALLGAHGGQSIGYMTALLAAVGYAVTISELTDTVVGIMVAGDLLAGDWYLYGLKVTFSADATGEAIIRFVIERIKPAPVIVWYNNELGGEGG